MCKKEQQIENPKREKKKRIDIIILAWRESWVIALVLLGSLMLQSKILNGAGIIMIPKATALEKSIESEKERTMRSKQRKNI